MRMLSTKEILEILRLHEMWCNDEEGGVRADFSNADLRGFDFSDKILRGADFRYAVLRDARFYNSDLRYAVLRYARFYNSDLRNAHFSNADLREARFIWADLRHADFYHADLRGADFDYSVFPLWCGGSRFKADMKLARQILAHLCSLDIVDADDEYKEALAVITKIAEKSHRARDLGIIN